MAEGETRTQDAAAPLKFGEGFLYDIWYFAALSGDLKPGKLQRYEILGQPVLLGRDRDGKAYALRDICPHRAAPLSAGRMVKDDQGREAVECPYPWLGVPHRRGMRQDPLAGGRPGDGRGAHPRAPLSGGRDAGLIFIWMASGEGRDAEPDVAPPTFEGIVGGAPKLVDRMDFDAHIDHAVVGLMDPAHGPYVHQQWWWRSKSHQLEKAKAFEPREAGFAMASHSPSKNSRAYKLLGGKPQTEITFRLPGLRWEHVKVGSRQVLSLTCLTPVTGTRTRITQVIWSDHPVFALLKPVIAVGARAFLRQDGDMVNLQNQGLRYDPSLLWIDDADRQAKWYQALKKEWAAARKAGRPFENPVKAEVLRWKS